VELAQQLTTEFGKGWSERQLRYCLRIAEVFPDAQILHTLCSQLSWSHLRLIIQIDEPLKRDFYIEICRVERWSVRQLQERINSLLFERTAISKKPEETIRQDLTQLRTQGQQSADLTFRDPYVLDFLGLSDSYSEKDLESAILAELQRFIIELGSDFAFMARQKRITTLVASSNSPTHGHPKFPQAARSDYDGSALIAMRAAASLSL
jgi:predicted nuclease of restriction endonuclease-like (RecB) superfamily